VNHRYLVLAGLVLVGYPLQADNTDALMKTMTGEGGRISNNDKDLFNQSIRSTKGSIARDMLDSFYSDAVELQNDRRYTEALELYEKILSIDANYKDVNNRRERILKLQSNAQQVSVRRSAVELIRQGDASMRQGLTLQAIGYWEQALAKDPQNAEARKKIDQTKKDMARRQFESGYIHYKHNELEDALDSWQNAIAFDPALKNKGLLMLMSKVEVQLRQNQVTRLANQGYDQQQAGDLRGALRSYDELLTIQPRHEDARRSRAKLRIQLGQQEMKAAQQAAAENRYQDAIERYQATIDMGWEKGRAEAGISQMQAALAKSRQPVVVAKPAVKVKNTPKPPEDDKPAIPPPAVAVDPKKAKEHYRNGLAAIRSKDYERAVNELEKAKELDATDERIYMALERAKQEWRSAGTGQ